MARSSRMSMQKRQRERKKAEKAELKRAGRRQAGAEERAPGAQVADRDALEGYGVIVAPGDDTDAD